MLKALEKKSILFFGKLQFPRYGMRRYRNLLKNVGIFGNIPVLFLLINITCSNIDLYNVLSGCLQISHHIHIQCGGEFIEKVFTPLL